MYRLARSALFALDPEKAHALTLTSLARTASLNAQLFGRRVPASPRRVMGLDFPNPVGLAAGLDKDGRCVDGLGALGFGFLEIGTVTPRPQPGNPRPRVFRLPGAGALINRLGFNNDGVEALLERLAGRRYRGILGINIGKNATTPLERAADDYLWALERVYPQADYVTVNISSPNTVGLRDLQAGEALDALLADLKTAQQRLADQHGCYVPLAVKVAPDLDAAALQTMADSFRRAGVDAVIATNTTLGRPGVAGHPLAAEQGGLSGAPMAAMANEVIAALAGALAGEIPIIGVGGIDSGEAARAKLAAGASLVQMYTGLIYRGPGLVAECARALREPISPANATTR
ncbi:MAG: quinone-dependent dihydroorotate dehydrogenase [Salinisphaeraceae bacterium]